MSINVGVCQAGIVATFYVGVMQVVTAPFANILAKYIPRTSLMASIAGLSITFMGMTFSGIVFESPVFTLLPMVVVVSGRSACGSQCTAVAAVCLWLCARCVSVIWCVMLFLFLFLLLFLFSSWCSCC